jgi:hypothetical protein
MNMMKDMKGAAASAAAGAGDAMKDKVAGAVDAAGDAAKEAALLKIEQDLAAKAPFVAKPFFPMCGVIPTLEQCEMVIPADQQDEFRTGISEYKTMKEKDIAFDKAAGL